MQEAGHASCFPRSSGARRGKATYRHYNWGSTLKSCKHGCRRALGFSDKPASSEGSAPHPSPSSPRQATPTSPLARPEGASECPAQQLLLWRPPWTSQDGPEACSPPSECLISEDTCSCFRGVCCFLPGGHTGRRLTKPLTGPLGPPAHLDCGTGLISQWLVGLLPSGAGGSDRKSR